MSWAVGLVPLPPPHNGVKYVDGCSTGMNGYRLFIAAGGAFHIFNGWMDGRCMGVGGASSLKGTYVIAGVFAWLCVVAC